METKQETENTKAFYEEYRALLEKHNVKDAAFCGEIDGIYTGSATGNARDIMPITMNVARLYQYCREQVRYVMTEIDKSILNKKS